MRPGQFGAGPDLRWGPALLRHTALHHESKCQRGQEGKEVSITMKAVKLLGPQKGFWSPRGKQITL